MHGRAYAWATLHYFGILSLHCRILRWLFHSANQSCTLLGPSVLFFLSLKTSLDLFSSSKHITVASLSIKTSDFLILLAKTFENKENHFISIIQIEGDIFNPFLLRWKIKIEGKRGQIKDRVRLK